MNDFSYLLRPDSVNDYRYLHTLLTDGNHDGAIYRVFCSFSYITDDDGNVENGGFHLFV